MVESTRRKGRLAFQKQDCNKDRVTTRGGNTRHKFQISTMLIFVEIRKFWTCLPRQKTRHKKPRSDIHDSISVRHVDSGHDTKTLRNSGPISKGFPTRRTTRETAHKDSCKRVRRRNCRLGENREFLLSMFMYFADSMARIPQVEKRTLT